MKAKRHIVPPGFINEAACETGIPLRAYVLDASIAARFLQVKDLYEKAEMVLTDLRLRTIEGP